MWTSFNRLKLLQIYRSTSGLFDEFFQEESQEESQKDINEEASIYISDMEVYTWLKMLEKDPS